ncbi:MAG: septal ring lytic transglycosylase RlpA family protein [Candidatus Adiutrix sp.]|jgi:rare lipoprotein A|nr:septal ring lytic transglycosylase RlpA family protein [Candidatus Adiutrix sp.]
MLNEPANHNAEKTSQVLSLKIDLSESIFYAKILLILGLVLLTGGCGFFGTNRSGKSYVINGQRYHILASAEGFREKGLASWYGEPFHGRQTASGEIYDMNRVTAAHKTLPLHTWVEVRNLETNKVLALRINDRGPFVKGRIIDLSRAAAAEMGLLKSGVAKVTVRAITGPRARQLADAQKQETATAASAGK